MIKLRIYQRIQKAQHIADTLRYKRTGQLVSSHFDDVNGGTIKWREDDVVKKS